MGPLPLIFGVTGHRDIRLADRDAIASLVGAVFDRYRARCPATPFILISGLAAGADRLVAQVACERGIAIHAALPLPLEEYEQDFSEPADLQEFRMLLDPRSHGCAERVYVVPAVAAEGTTAETAPARPHCYALLGAHIVRYCDVLIALWDGRQTGKEGGTADVVDKQLARTRNADQRPLLAHPDAGPTHHILTPRASLDGDTAIPLVGRELFPADHESADPAAYFEGIFADFEAFNRDAPLAADAPTQAAAILSTADAAGVRFRRQWFQRAEWVLGFAFVFALAFEVFVHARDFAQSQPGAVNLAIDWLWIVLLLLGLVSYATAYVRARPKKFRALQSKFLDYRGVAEGIRVQNYWHRAGLPDAAWQSYAPRQQSEIPWIRRAVRTAAYLELANAPRAQSESGDELAVLRTIRDQWIGSAGDASGQVGYFAARIASEGAALRKSSRWK
ncbi:MAG: hypothetical protein ACREM2_01505, partial [Vulcanimicrobiaceae bacterium]